MGLKDLLFGSRSEESSTQTQTGGGASSSRSSVAFEELFQSLYGGAGAAAASVNTGALSGAASQLFSGGLGFLEQLQGGGAGADALKARLSDTSGRDAQIEQLRTSLGDFFNEELLPGITDMGVATGTLGGDRERVAIEQAAKAVGGQFSTGAASILSSDQGQRDAVASTLAQIEQGGAGMGLNALGSLYGLAGAGETAALTPYELLASILGGPTVLQESNAVDFFNSSMTSKSKGGSQGLAQAFLGGGGLGMSFGA